MWNNVTISAVLPAYNEGKNICRSITDFFATGYVDEVVVVNNNSTDETAAEVKRTKALLVNEEKQGYGYALQRGLRKATGEYVITAEPDGTFRASDILKLLAYADDADMVLGTRTTKELVWDGANMGPFLKWGNRLVAKLLELLFNGPSLTDVGCTLRLIKRDALNKILDQLAVGGPHFLPEMTIVAILNGIKIIEIPVNYLKRVDESKITGLPLGAATVGLSMTWLILAYRVKTLFPRHKHKVSGTSP